MMERVTVRMTTERITTLNKRVEAGEYPNRSEAIRALVRQALADEQDDRVSTDVLWSNA